MNTPNTPCPYPRSQAITEIIASVAKEQAALGRILAAEAGKLEKILSFACVHPHEILKANQSVYRLVNSVSRLEMVLQSKLELFQDCLCDSPPRPMYAETE